MSKNEKTSKRGTARRRWHRGGSYIDAPSGASLSWWGGLLYYSIFVGVRLVEVIDE